MIGTVRFTLDDREHVATLHDDITWTVPGYPHIEIILNVGCGPDPKYSPADGIEGYPQLQKAAAQLGGTVEYSVKPLNDPDIIY